jgi:hypothetical protein
VVFERFWHAARPAVAVLSALVALPCAVLVVEGRPWDLSFDGNPVEGEGSPYPIGVVAYLRDEQFAGNLMTPFVYGAFASWCLYPPVRVSIDGRYEVAYADGVLEEHVALYGARDGWETLLDRYPTDAVLVPRDRPLADAMIRQETWPLVYRDDAFLVFARPGASMAHVDRRGVRLRGQFPGGALIPTDAGGSH